MNPYVWPIIGALLVGVCGFVLFQVSRTPGERAISHLTYAAALLMMAHLAAPKPIITSPIHPPQLIEAASGSELSLYASSSGSDVYHRLHCPLLRSREYFYRSKEEAEWAGKVPCTTCLLQHVKSKAAVPSARE